MLPAILATTVAVSYPFFSLLGAVLGWVGSGPRASPLSWPLSPPTTKSSRSRTDRAGTALKMDSPTTLTPNQRDPPPPPPKKRSARLYRIMPPPILEPPDARGARNGG